MKYTSKPYYSDLTIPQQCQEISINLKNNALVFQGRFQGKYQASVAANGQPYWTSKDNAMWLLDGTNWAIGTLQNFGKNDVELFSRSKHLSPYGKKSQWVYHNRKEWKLAKPDDIEITCTMKAGESVFSTSYILNIEF